jgi:general secretion pathway protein J
MRTHTRRRADVAGFTLVEALLATALMAVILAAIGTVTAQWLPNWNRGFERVQRVELLAAGVERIVTDIASAEFVTAGANIRQPVFDGGELGVTFLRTAVGPNTRGGLELIRIQETATEKGLAMVRLRARFQPIGRDGIETQARPSDPVVLVRAPYRITFSYAGPDRVWRPVWRGEGQLPSAIRVQLRDAASDRTLSVSTATLVHADMPADCVLAEAIADCLSNRNQPQAPQQEAPQPAPQSQQRPAG